MIEGQSGLIKEVIKAQSKRVSFSFGGAEKKPGYSGFPLKFFEDQSYVERLCEWFTYAPHFLD